MRALKEEKQGNRSSVQSMACNVVSRRAGDNVACEPAWPGGKALGWQAEGPRFDSPLRPSFHVS